MSPRPPLKRRRLDNSDALSKPFKSPFKSPFKTPLKATSNVPQPSPLHETATPSDATPSLKAKPRSQFQPTSSPTKASSPTKPSSPSKTSPELLALRRQQATLQSTLSTARSELDTYSQALKIEQGGKDAELNALIKKWRLASKDTAEEVFRGVRDRVNRMGGVKGWREAERKKREGFGGSYGWAEEEEKKTGGDDGEEEDPKRDDVGEAEARDEREGIEADERKRDKEDEVDEEGGFTMDMMLKSLNIDLDVVGFDKDGQRVMDRSTDIDD